MSGGQFVEGTICSGENLFRGRFDKGTLFQGDNLSRGQFLKETVCQEDNLSKGQCVKGTTRFRTTRINPLAKFCNILHSSVLKNKSETG